MKLFNELIPLIIAIILLPIIGCNNKADDKIILPAAAVRIIHGVPGADSVSLLQSGNKIAVNKAYASLGDYTALAANTNFYSVAINNANSNLFTTIINFQPSVKYSLMVSDSFTTAKIKYTLLEENLPNIPENKAGIKIIPLATNSNPIDMRWRDSINVASARSLNDFVSSPSLYDYAQIDSGTGKISIRITGVIPSADSTIKRLQGGKLYTIIIKNGAVSNSPKMTIFQDN